MSDVIENIAWVVLLMSVGAVVVVAIAYAIFLLGSD